VVIEHCYVFMFDSGSDSILRIQTRTGGFLARRPSRSRIEVYLLPRSVSLAALIATVLALPNAGDARAQSPQKYPPYTTPQPEVALSSMNTDGRAAIRIRRAIGTVEGVSHDVGSPELLVPGVARTLSTEQSTAQRVDNEVFSHNADNWKRARIVGYTLGALAVCFAAFVFYGVMTGT
jgi:hypothetical protein